MKKFEEPKPKAWATVNKFEMLMNDDEAPVAADEADGAD